MGIFMFLLYVRFNGLIYDAISWDEATYMIAGRDLINGLIPYKDFLELKPPLVFFIYSIPALIDDNSFIIFRLYGYAYLFIASIILFLIIKKNQNLNLSLLLVFLFISLMNYHFWLWNSTELFSLPFILLSYLFLLKKNFLLSGLMISLSTLIRINYSFTVIFIVFYILIKIYKKDYTFLNLYNFALGGLIPLFLFLIYFIHHDALLDFKISNFDIFIAYSGEHSLINGIYNLFKALFKLNYFSWHIFLPFTILLFLTEFSNIKNNKVLQIYVLSIFLSIAASGHAYSHHIIQLIPFLIIFISNQDMNVNNYKNLIKKNLIYASIIITLIISSLNNFNLFKNNQNINKYHLHNRMIEKINDINSKAKILALDYLIIPWKVKSPRIHKITHTPSIFRNTTKSRLKPYIDNNIYKENYIDDIYLSNPDIIICSVRICEESRENYDNNMISDLLSNYEEIYREENVSRWEYTKKGSIIIYRSKIEPKTLKKFN